MAAVPQSSQSLIAALAGAHFGVLEAVEQVPFEPDNVPIVVFAGRLANTRALGPCEAPRAVSGAGCDSATAVMACLGEGMERYAAALPAPDTVVQAAAAELPGPAVSPDRFALFSQRQYRRHGPDFPFVPWAAGHRCGWARATRLRDGEPVWVPAQAVYQPYTPAAGEPLYMPSLSTGLACGATLEDAVERGFCEVVERDAVALAWLGCLSPPRFDITARPLSSAAASLIDTLDAMGLRWRALDLKSDVGVPVAAALMDGHSPVGRIVSFGAGCHPDPDRALLKALVEAAHCRVYVKSLVRREPGWRAGKGFDRLHDFSDHARFYTSHPEHHDALEPWWHSEESPPAPAPPAADWLHKAITCLARRDIEILYVDLTTPDIKSLGFHVARVLAPGLQPLHGNHHWAHLGGVRLQRLAEVFGPPAAQPRRFNPYPHPCP